MFLQEHEKRDIIQTMERKIQHNTRRVVRDRRYSIFERIITHKVLRISQVRWVYLVCKIGSRAHLRNQHPPPHNHRLTGLHSLYKKYFYINCPISPKNGEQTPCLNVLWANTGKIVVLQIQICRTELFYNQISHFHFMWYGPLFA